MTTYLLISIVAIIAIVLIIGLFLPKERTFTKKAVLNSDVTKVFNIVTDFKNQTTWRNDVKEIIVIDDNTWTEVPKKGTAITFKVKQKIENEIFEIEICEVHLSLTAITKQCEPVCLVVIAHDSRNCFTPIQTEIEVMDKHVLVRAIDLTERLYN